MDDVERILSEAKAATETMSLFGGGKLVWINEANFINQNKTGAAQGSKDALEKAKKFLENPGDSKIILSACPVHRGHGFVKWLQKNSDFHDLAKGEKEDVAFRRLVEETASSLGVKFGPGALEYLAGKIGAHPASGGTNKLASFLGSEGTEITEQVIIDLVPDFGGRLFETGPSFPVNWTGHSMLSIATFFRARMPPPARHSAKPQPFTYPTLSGRWWRTQSARSRARMS